MLELYFLLSGACRVLTMMFNAPISSAVVSGMVIPRQEV